MKNHTHTHTCTHTCTHQYHTCILHLHLRYTQSLLFALIKDIFTALFQTNLYLTFFTIEQWKEVEYKSDWMKSSENIIVKFWRLRLDKVAFPMKNCMHLNLESCIVLTNIVVWGFFSVLVYIPFFKIVSSLSSMEQTPWVGSHSFCHLTYSQYCLWDMWVYLPWIEEFVTRKVVLFNAFHCMIVLLNTYTWNQLTMHLSLRLRCYIKLTNQEIRHDIKQLCYSEEWSFGINATLSMNRKILLGFTLWNFTIHTL